MDDSLLYLADDGLYKNKMTVYCIKLGDAFEPIEIIEYQDTYRQGYNLMCKDEILDLKYCFASKESALNTFHQMWRETKPLLVEYAEKLLNQYNKIMIVISEADKL